MATRFTMPIEQVLKSDASGVGAGWQLFFYETGTETAKDTYSEETLTTANSNPVVADSSGRFGDIFLAADEYRVILKDADDTEIWDADPVQGAVGTSGAVLSKTAAYTVTISDLTKIIACDASSGAFTVTLLAAADAGDGAEITIKKTDSSVNAVTVDGDSSETIDGQTTYVLNRRYDAISLRSDASNWHVLSTRGEEHAQGTDIASATTITIPVDGTYFDVTGTTTITGITVAAGRLFVLQFDGALTFTDGASLDLAGSNITTAAGDRGIFYATAADTVQLLGYLTEGSPALTAAPSQATQAALEAETNEDTFVPPDLIRRSPGVASGWGSWGVDGTLDDSLNMDALTDNGTGDWTVNWTADFDAATYAMVCGIELSGDVQNTAHYLSKAADTVNVVSLQPNGANTETNVSTVSVAAWGDYA